MRRRACALLGLLGVPTGSAHAGTGEPRRPHGAGPERDPSRRRRRNRLLEPPRERARRSTPRPSSRATGGALGGDGAIAKAARLRVRQRTKELGLDGSETYIIDGARMRSESTIPVLAADAVQVWDGKRLSTRGWNGDVRTQGRTDRAHAITMTSLLSLGYLRDPSTSIRARAPVDESGTLYERLIVTPEGGAPAELWVRPDGLTDRGSCRRAAAPGPPRRSAREVRRARPPEGRRQERRDDEERDTITVESVDFLATAADDTLFAPPAAKLDAVFPKGATKVTVPAGFLRERYLSVSGSLGGRSSLFLVDTGASTTVFDEDFLAEAGVRPAGGAAFASDALFKGVRFARVPKFEVAGIRLGPQVALAIPLRRSEGFPLPVDGILGYDFWSRFVTSIDYPMGTMTFHRPDTYAPDAADVAIPFELEGTTMHVPVTVNGKDAGTFTLDTGNGGEITLHRFDGIDRLCRGLNPSASRADRLRLERRRRLRDLGRSRLGPFVYKSAPVLLLDPRDPAGAATGGNGNVGVDFLAIPRHLRLRALRRPPAAERALRPAAAVGVSGMTIRLPARRRSSSTRWPPAGLPTRPA